MREQIIKWGLPIIFFLLPWQTRWIFGQELIGGASFEYGVLSFYAVEFFILIYLFVSGRWQIKYQKQIWLTLLIVAVSALSLISALNRTITLMQIMHLIFAMILFLALLDSRVSLKRVLFGFVAGLIAPAGLGIYQFLTGGSPAISWFGLAARDAANLGDAVIELDGQRVLRAYGSLPHPNIFGGFLAVAIAGIVGFWNQLKTRAQIILSGLAGAWLSIALLLTFSRSAWLGLALGLGLGILVLVMKNTARARLLMVPIAVIVIGVALFGATGRLSGSSILESRSISERVTQYQEFPKVVGSHWILGQGIGNYTLAIAQAFPSREWWQYQPIHNVPLLIIGEIGILGLLLVLLWSSSMDKINYARFPNREAVTAFMMGNVILVILFFDHYLWSSWAGLALVALVMALTTRLGEEKKL